LRHPLINLHRLSGWCFVISTGARPLKQQNGLVCVGSLGLIAEIRSETERPAMAHGCLPELADG
jgi:hypothetical protein